MHRRKQDMTRRYAQEIKQAEIKARDVRYVRYLLYIAHCIPMMKSSYVSSFRLSYFVSFALCRVIQRRLNRNDEFLE